MTSSNLDTTFQALSDPTRRAIIARLRSSDETSLGELASPFDMSLPGVMKHVGILEAAGLVEREKVGRTVFCRLNAAPMAEAIAWLQEMERFWSQRLESLADFVERDATQATAHSTQSKSQVKKTGSKPRRKTRS